MMSFSPSFSLRLIFFIYKNVFLSTNVKIKDFIIDSFSISYKNKVLLFP